jgi:carboxyl-terminal processing protease
MARLPLSRATSFVTMLSALACSDAVGTGNASPGLQHLTEVVGIMEANSVYRLTIDWKAFRDSVFKAAKGGRTLPDTYRGISVALSLLRDGHSQYRPVLGSTISAPINSCVSSGATTPVLPANIGYVRVGSFSGSSTAATDFAAGIQETIRTRDRADLVGWIVDLRGNGGGNMWPMVAGLGPILGEGIVGHFIGPTGSRQVWHYQAGASILDATTVVRVDPAYRLLRENPRVAVLVDNAVASSGEATFIAFRGRPDTRSFGAATCGLSTANQGFTLSNGATLILTTAIMADRNLNPYGGQVAPDYIGTSNADVEANAIGWLQH